MLRVIDHKYELRKAFVIALLLAVWSIHGRLAQKPRSTQTVRFCLVVALANADIATLIRLRRWALLQ
jgi:hypothetical protein